MSIQKKEEEIYQIFEDFNQLKVLVVGDVMLDAYYFGEVTRISPEAPVPIVDIKKKSNHLGGAANVALNTSALGCKTWIASVVGNDKHGDSLKEAFENAKINIDGLITSDKRQTTVKTRIIGNNNQLLRIDEEEKNDLDEEDTESFLSNIYRLIDNIEPDLILFEDYNKGVLYSKTIEAIINIANKKKLLTAVDPKKHNFWAYKNVGLFKPNLKELEEGLNMEASADDLPSLKSAVDKLEAQLNNQFTLLTLSENGMLIKAGDYLKHIEAHKRDITDVSGAGDTVIAVAACCLALKVSFELTLRLANLAGGLVCEKIGVVPINKNQLLEEALPFIKK